MPRLLPPDQRRAAEEAVRQGVVAAVVMEAAAREWAGQEGEEPFLDWLVRREVLPRATVDALVAAVASDAPEAPAPGGAAAEPGAPVPHPSEVVKGYRILERLGRGGMGSVYRAEQAGMNRVVALKILRRPFGSQEEHVERLRREARLVGSLDHPHIVRGLDVGQHGPYHYFAMEFVEGETLRETLKKRGVLPEAEALRIVEQVCLALDHAHSRGIVHRDVKPGNIILAPDGTPKLTDYGLAKGPADFTLTQSGVTIGTPQYISPEQARDPAGADIQTDLYSLGATAYNMLTGIPPHTSDTLAGLLTKVLYEKPRTARQVNPRVSAGGSFLVEKMMAKEKRYRYRTPREVLRDLRALAAGKSIVPRNWGGDFEVHATRRKLRWAAAIAGFALLASAGAILALSIRAERQEKELREGRAQATLDGILAGTDPDTKRGWEQRIDDLDAYLNRQEYERTIAREIAERERNKATTRHSNWIAADAASGEAKRLEQAEKFVSALAGLDRVLADLQAKGGEARDAHKWLAEERRGVASRGFDRAERAAKEAVDEAKRVPAAEGTAVELVSRTLERALDRIRADLVEDPDARPAAEIQRVLDEVRQARVSVEDSHLGLGWKEYRDRGVKEGEFRAADEELARRAAAMEADATLQSALARIPLPAAEDLRSRPQGEHRRLRDLNLLALDAASREALRLEAGGDVPKALEVLARASERSLEELAESPRTLALEIEQRRAESLALGEKSFREFRDRFLSDLSRRAYGAARKDLDGAWEGTKTAAGGGDRLRAFLEAADFLLQLFQREAYGRVAERIAEGGDLPLGLRFEEGSSQPHPKVSNVRLRETPAGLLIQFEVPGIQGEGLLHRLSLEHLFAYSGLAGEGLTDPQALVKSALVIAEALDPASRVARKDVEEAHARLRAIQGRIPPARPILDALLEAADAVVEREIRKEKDQEQLAKETFERGVRFLGEEPRDPLEAKRLFELLLSGSLSRTAFAKERRGHLEDLHRQAEAQIRDNKLNSVFPGARIEEAPGVVSGESLSRMTFSFDGTAGDALRGLLAPEDGGPRLYAVVPEEVDGHAGGGCVRFVEGAGGRDLRDNPLEMECPFKSSPSRPILVSFRYRSESPLYLQVSIAGVHVGILTDDGRRTSGRGVYAWLSEDWRDPDRAFPIQYRHDWIERQYAGRDPAKEVIKEGAQQGQRYFQLEPGREYKVRVEWSQKRLKLFVDDQRIWLADLGYAREARPRIRIVTFTPAWVDDLVVEGVVDRQHLEKLSQGK